MGLTGTIFHFQWADEWPRNISLPYLLLRRVAPRCLSGALVRAKINLYLHVGPVGSDGYHPIASLISFADFGDEVRLGPGAELSLTVDGPFARHAPADEANLALRAARVFVEETGVGEGAIRVSKQIPAGAGLGGGSADAAATLQALGDLWRVALPVEELFDLAHRLGADVPMCLAGRASLVSGVGERLTPVPPLPDCALLLVNAGVRLPTAEVFAARRRGFSMAKPFDGVWRDLVDFAEALAARGNDLADAAISQEPVVADVVAALRAGDGVRYAAMSGSGATCFAIYDDAPRAARASEALPATWWRHVGRFI